MVLFKQNCKNDSAYDHILASFEHLKSFYQSVSNCQYYSIKTCHFNTNLNAGLTTIHKAGAIIDRNKK